MLTISGGPVGGSQYDGSALVIGDEFSVDGCRCRKVSEEQAVFVGVEEISHD